MPNKLSTNKVFNLLTQNSISCRIGNLRIGGLDKQGNVYYTPEVRVTIGRGGRDLRLFLGSDLEEVLNDALKYCYDNHLLN